jgi:hypothetical protein
MLKAVLFKEYLKIRWYWLTLAALNALLMGYVFIETRHLFVLDHAEMVWYRVIHLGQIHFTQLKYAPLLTGLLTACIQYLPEMVGERFRLSLHLPVALHRLVMAHLCVGLMAVLLIIGLDMAMLARITAWYFPAEVVSTALLTAFPWGLAGVASYLGVTLGLLEPDYRLRLVSLAMAAGVASLFLYPVEPGAYRHVLGFLWPPVLLMAPAVLLPAYHFRYRKVS